MHNESVESRNKGLYRELLELSAKYDPITDNHLKIAKVFKRTTPTTQNALVDAIANQITEKIEYEIPGLPEIPFFALSLNEMTDNANNIQLATIMQFVYNKRSFQERFLNFTNVSKRRVAKRNNGTCN